MPVLRSTLLVVALTCASLGAHAASRPYTATESARVALPAGYTGRSTAIEGSWVAVLGVDRDAKTAAVFLYRRASASSWTLSEKIYERPYDPENDGLDPPLSLALEGGILAFNFGGKSPVIFRRSGSVWVPQTVAPAETWLESPDTRIDGARVMVGKSGNCGDAVIFEPDATGTWQVTGQLNNVPADCAEISWPFAFDLSGDYAIVHARDDNRGPYQHNVYRRSATTGSWSRIGSLPVPIGSEINSWDISLRGSVAVAESRYPDPMHVLLRSGSNWTELPGFRPLDAYRLDTLSGGFRERRGWLVQSRDDMDIPYRQSPNAILDVWRQQTDNRFLHVAQLEERGRQYLVGVDIDDTRIAAVSASGELLVFELPSDLTTPAPVRDDFDGHGNASWHTVSGSPPTVVSGRYSFASSSRAITLTSGSNWASQAVEADFRLGTSSSQGRAGLVARYNSGNFYYAALTADNQVQLGRINGGTRTVLASAAFTPNHPDHRLRLEARGQLLDVSLDGAILIRTYDSALRSGEAGFIGENAAFSADDFHVSPRSLKMFATNGFTDDPFPGDSIYPGRWTLSGGTWANAQEGDALVRQQRAATGAARAVTGVPTDDQSAQARLRADSTLAADSNWVGVIARYTDNQNLYYLSLRGSHRVEIRKVVGGVATTLAFASFTAQTSKFYDLRLDAVGNQLRGFIDGELKVQVTDSDLTTGRAGMATNNARASFADFLSYQP